MARELDINTYTFHSGEKVTDITSDRFDDFMRSFEGDLRVEKGYATESEYQLLQGRFSILKQIIETTMKPIQEGTKNFLSTEEYRDIQEQMMLFDDYSRFIAVNHWNQEQSRFDVATENYPNGYDNWHDSVEENLDEGIEQIQSNGGMSEAAIEAEIMAEENPRPDYIDEQGNPHSFDEEEDYDDGQIPLEVVDRTEMLYFNSDKVSAREYKIRIDEGLFKQLAPEQYSETSFSDGEIPAITYRQSTNPEVPDQFLISKFKLENYGYPLIQTTIEIKDEELLRQIKFNVEDYEAEWQRIDSELSPYYERFEKEAANRSEGIQLQKAIELALEKQTVQLQEVKLNRENWNKLFPNGTVETPIGSVKLGANQFEKLQKADRDNLLVAMYETLSNPAIVLEKETLDEKSGEFRPVNVYGKSFVREDSDHKKVIESVIIFKDGENISIGTHNKELGRFTRQIKTADQIIFADSEISRVTSLVLQNGGSHVQLKGINTQALNPHYDKNNLLSIKDLEFSNADEILQNDSSSLEQKTLNEAADLLKNMQFTPDNYKKLLNVINEISDMNGLKNLAVPKEEEIVSKKENHETFKDVVDSISETRAGETLKTIAEHGAGIPEGSIETAQAVQDKIYEAVHGEPKTDNSVETEKQETLIQTKSEENEQEKSQTQIKNPQEEKIKAEISKLKERMKNAYDSIDEGDEWEYKSHYINIARECEREIEKLEKQLHPDLPEKQETLIQTESEENEQEKSQTQLFDGKSEIVFGETTLPAFSVLVDGKMRSIENAVINGHNKNTGSYFVESNGEKIELPKETFDTLFNDKIEQEQQKARLAEGKTIVFENKEQGIKGTEIPEWSMYTTKGLESFKGFVAQKFNQSDNTFILSNGDSTITVSAERFKEITAPERFENKFDKESPAYKKLCEKQYKDFFETRDNTAHNFKHNLSVFCRKEANSPVDALHLAKEIVDQMSKEEQKRTKKLLKTLAYENETTNELITRIYHDAVKEQPLNEEYMKSFQQEKVIAWTMPDIVSGNGQKVENDPALIKGEKDRNLKIGMTLKNVNMEIGKLFGKGNDTMHFDELKVISATKEGNSITVMDGNKSYFKLPRDTVLNVYKEQQMREMKQEQKQNRSNTMSLSYA